MPDNTHLPGGVFISYARQGTDAARRIAETLRDFGVDGWFDQGELRGGEAFMSLRKVMGALESASPVGGRIDAAWSRPKDDSRFEEIFKAARPL